MPNTCDVDAILDQANKKEKEYDWLGAVETYGKGFDSVSGQDFSSSGELYERLGYAFRRAAMQADDANEFKDRMTKAISSYDKAREVYEKTGENDTATRAKVLRCDATKAYVEHWLIFDSSEKKKLLDKSWRLATESMGTFEEVAELEEYAKTYLQLSDMAIFLFTREYDFKSREKVIQEAVESGEKAIKYLSERKDASDLAKAYTRTVVFLGVFGYYFHDIDEREKYRLEGLDYWSKAKELSEAAAMTEFLYPVFGGQVFFGLEGAEDAFENYEKGLEYSKKMNDKFFIGCALDWLLYHTAWKLEPTEDPGEKVSAIEKCVKYAHESMREFSKVCFLSPRGDNAWAESIEIMRLVWLGGLETDLKKKRDLNEKALQLTQNLRKLCEESGYPEIMRYWDSGAAMFRRALAKFETNPADKKKILEEALTIINDGIRISEKLEPFLYWNRGIGRSSLSYIEYELSDVTEDSEKKKVLLQKAIADKQKSIELCIKELSFMTRKGSGTSLFASV